MRSGSCPRRQMRPAELLCSTRRAFSIYLPIVFTLILLPAIAFASPPDPSWIRGVYDDADFDDVVCLIIANTGLVHDVASVEGRPDFVLMGAEVPRDDRSVALLSLGSSQPRAPPAA
jgi:hypothetical protein